MSHSNNYFVFYQIAISPLIDTVSHPQIFGVKRISVRNASKVPLSLFSLSFFAVIFGENAAYGFSKWTWRSLKREGGRKALTFIRQPSNGGP